VSNRRKQLPISAPGVISPGEEKRVDEKMAILILKEGKQYQERCPVCHGIHIYDQKQTGSYSETERYVCPDCGRKTVAPMLHYLEVSPAPAIPEARESE
jgi:hypothetical protein